MIDIDGNKTVSYDEFLSFVSYSLEEIQRYASQLRDSLSEQVEDESEEAVFAKYAKSSKRTKKSGNNLFMDVCEIDLISAAN